MPPSSEPDRTLRRAWRIERAGSLTRLKSVSEPLPPPATGEVQVEVEAIGVNFADVFACLGLYSATPKGSFVPGLECAGRIRRLGRDVTGWREGDAVIVLTRFGGYTTHLNVDARLVHGQDLERQMRPSGLRVDARHLLLEGLAAPGAEIPALQHDLRRVDEHLLLMQRGAEVIHVLVGAGLLLPVGHLRHEAAEAAIRQAMDPANQSLGDALKLSYRLLQFAILGLLVTFLFSGFQTVKEGFSGVKTVFGRVVGDEALSPGLTPFWPYPVGEITAFEVRRPVELRADFWPRASNKNLTVEAQIEAADGTQPLRPGIDGSVITGDGDLAHLQLTAEYAVEDPVRFLQAIDLEQADQLVRVALQRGVVVAGSRMSLSELIDQREQPVAAIQAEAQRVLDGMQSGIKLARVALPERSAPFAVRNELGRVQKNREDAKTAVDRARQDATKMLVEAAGKGHEQLLDRKSTRLNSSHRT